MIMEDEDFGFTRRDDIVLKKALTVGNEQPETNRRTDCNAKKCIPPANKGEQAAGVSRSVTRTGTSGGNGAGSEDPARSLPVSSGSGSPSVALSPPNIPNVVEYHLKVKPRSTTTVYRLEDYPKQNRAEEMKKEKSLVVCTEKKKDLISKLSRLSIDKNVFEGSTDLPQVFQVKYLGSHDARGLWGIKHTRRPVDNMVAAAKALPSNTMLPLIKLVISEDGVVLLPLDKRKQVPGAGRMYTIETISYGVQDLVYTRVFSMIVVRETENFRRVSPFECHGFVCESKHHARQLTYALATAFEIYSRTVKARDKLAEMAADNTKKRFAIDLRSPDEIEADLTMDSEA